MTKIRIRLFLLITLSTFLLQSFARDKNYKISRDSSYLRRVAKKNKLSGTNSFKLDAKNYANNADRPMLKLITDKNSGQGGLEIEATVVFEVTDRADFYNEFRTDLCKDYSLGQPAVLYKSKSNDNYKKTMPITGKEELERMHLNFLQPSPNSLTISKNTQSTLDFLLIDVSGRLVKTGKLIKYEIQELINLPSGVYFFRVIDVNNNSITKKIVVI